MPTLVIASLWTAILVGTAFSGVAAAQSRLARDGAFTDSTGRTILYRVWTRSDWNSNEPRGVLVYFHGNNTGTADDMRRTGWVDTQQAFRLGLTVAIVASPGSSGRGDAYHPTELFGSDIDKFGTRSWNAKRDSRLIHELLQSGFNSQLAVDHERVVFMGQSQGACFLNHFLHLYAGIYGGGFHLHCGCFWGPSASYYHVPRETNPWAPTYQWTPHGASYASDRVRVFVEATTEDHLYSQSVDMAEYYSQILGLDTRSDLDAPGGHCSDGSTPDWEAWEWLSSVPVPPRPTVANDADGDGIRNAVDPDDDNDGAPDVIDAVPLEPRDWLDTDRDGIGNFADRDADGDGVDNADDPFPLDPREWRDNDADGIGDTLDADDDNDGLPDSADADPLHGTTNDQLSFHRVEAGVHYVSEIGAPYGRHPAAAVHEAPPAYVIYPEPRGNRQSYQFIELGDTAARFEIMIDRLDRDEPCEAGLLPAFCSPGDPETPYPYFEHYIDWIHVDRNRNQDLTDDGPPLVRAGNTADGFSAPRPNYAVLEVPYASGDVFPYGILLSTWSNLAAGAFYHGASTWMGYVKPPSGEPVLVATVDVNVDGLFNTGEAPDDFDGPVRDLRDITCIDFDRNGVLNECEETEDYTGERVSPVYPGQPFELDGRQWAISVAPSGHSVAWFTADENRPPEVVGVLARLAIAVGDPAATVDVSGAFRDPDGDALAYEAASSAPAVAAVAVAGNALTVTPVSEGTALVTVTATDTGGSNTTATQAFRVTVSRPAMNRPPEPVGTLAALTIGVRDPAATVDVSGAFRDPDGDALAYEAASSAPAVAAVAVSGSTLTVTPVSEGMALVTVTATDTAGSNTTATQTFSVTTVLRPFTDHQIVPGTTPVRAVHFTELRDRINTLRVANGLGRFGWTNPALRAGVTGIRLVHLTELRTALEAAYTAAGRPVPRWTDPAPVAGTTPIRAVHLTELRAAVVALE